MERNYRKRKEVVGLVADIDPHRIVKNLTSTQNIKTMITSQPLLSTNFDIQRNGTKSSKSIPAPTSEQENNCELIDRRPKIIIL
jgi:hypothetical protein